ncbi:transmembrane protein 26-like [Tubulanus polymorphus]|uniref:transmembrane protein 26-like n=1 Tax=Tubulanus polymorphus TaxID=672921 RepID=UPI003DA2555A
MLAIGRCLLPNDFSNRILLTQMLLGLIANGADVIEFFQIQNDMKLKGVRDPIIFVHLALWSFSMLPFCFSLSLLVRREEDPAPKPTTDESSDEKEQTRKEAFKDVLFAERWSVILDVTCMDAPYLAARIYVMIEYNIFTSTLLFFAVKNAFKVVGGIALFFMMMPCCKGKAASKTSKVSPDDIEA